MADYAATIEVAAEPERAFQVFTDAARFPQWQAAALRAFDQTGPLSELGSTVRIEHGPRMVRQLTVLEADPPYRLRYRQQGMGFDDTTEVRFDRVGTKTRVTMTATLRVAGGPIGRVLERLTSRQTRREFQAELDRFGSVVERPQPTHHAPGTLLTGESGAGLRLLKVIAQEDDSVHLAVLPGIAPDRQPDPEPFLDAVSRVADPLKLQPLAVPIRRMASRIVPGQPVLRLDGGVGVPHVVLSPDAFADASPQPLGRRIDVWDHERTEVAGWRAGHGPVLGRDVDAGLTPLLTVRVDNAYAPAKLLHVDRRGVHIRLYSDRWAVPPEEINPWRLELGKITDPTVGIGHMPLTRAAFSRFEPEFDRLVMIAPHERDGYRDWLEAGGGYFG